MSEVSPHLPFELPIAVAVADIDQMGHVNNVVYLRWVQEAAIAHWNVVANADEKRALLWVVVRHEVDYRRPAFAGDEIVARTWVGGVTRRAFERHTEIVRATDGKVLVKALTLWHPIDAQTRRPVAVPAAVAARFSVVGDWAPATGAKPPTGFAVVYRWRLQAGHEEEFKAAWAAVTRAIVAERGGLGSRLHRAEDGSWVAYAQWPTRGAWERSQELGPIDAEVSARMSAAVVSSDPPLLLDPVQDLLEKG